MRGKFTKTLNQTLKKTNNAPTGLSAKIDIRRRVLAKVGPGKASVFDAFAGDGAMFDAVWKDAKRYVGCDLEWYRGQRLAYVADNRRVLRALDLYGYNLFDLDAHGSPWEQAYIIARRRPMRPGERLGFILTEGSGLKLKLGGYPNSLCVMAGINPSARGGARQHPMLIDRAILRFCRLLGGELAHRWQAKGKTGAAVHYIGIVVEAKKKAAPKDGQSGQQGENG